MMSFVFKLMILSYNTNGQVCVRGIRRSYGGEKIVHFPSIFTVLRLFCDCFATVLRLIWICLMNRRWLVATREARYWVIRQWMLSCYRSLSTSTRRQRGYMDRGWLTLRRACCLTWVKMMNFVIKTRKFALKTRHCVSKTRNFVLLWWILQFKRVATMTISDANKRRMMLRSKPLIDILLECLMIDKSNRRSGQAGADELQEVTILH